MDIQLVRHATLFVNFNKKRILVDPMLGPAGAYSSAVNSANTFSNPLVNLKVNVSDLIKPDAILLTHSHRDHFDSVAACLLPKDTPFFCQPHDFLNILNQGFTNAQQVSAKQTWAKIELIRTGGQHGSGEMGKRMGPVSGFVLKADGEPTVYIAGDTIWCEEVEETIGRHHPDVIVLFAGAAQFLTGGPITMTEQDIEKVCKASPDSKIIVAHMEAWNHCLLSREDLSSFLLQKNFKNQVLVPNDGDTIHLGHAGYIT